MPLKCEFGLRNARPSCACVAILFRDFPPKDSFKEPGDEASNTAFLQLADSATFYSNAARRYPLMRSDGLASQTLSGGESLVSFPIG